MPNTLVNIGLEKTYVVQSYENLPGGALTLLCDQATVVWKAPGAEDGPGVGAYRAIV